MKPGAEGTPVIPSPSPLCWELRGPGLSHQPTPTSPCSIDLPAELGPGLGVNGVNTLLDLRWFPILQSQDHGPSERVVVFCFFFFKSASQFHLHPSPTASPSLHPRDPPAGSRWQLLWYHLRLSSSWPSPFCASPSCLWSCVYPRRCML